jgi:hypothetical protein
MWRSKKFATSQVWTVRIPISVAMFANTISGMSLLIRESSKYKDHCAVSEKAHPWRRYKVCCVPRPNVMAMQSVATAASWKRDTKMPEGRQKYW